MRNQWKTQHKIVEPGYIGELQPKSVVALRAHPAGIPQIPIADLSHLHFSWNATCTKDANHTNTWGAQATENNSRKSQRQKRHNLSCKIRQYFRVGGSGGPCIFRWKRVFDSRNLCFTGPIVGLLSFTSCLVHSCILQAEKYLMCCLAQRGIVPWWKSIRYDIRSAGTSWWMAASSIF